MEFIKDFINFLTIPQILITLASILLFVGVRYRKLFFSDKAALILFPSMVVFLLVSMLDEDFLLIVTKPDNVPIVGMLFLIPFFTWFSMREGIRNDDRKEAGEPVVEKEETAKKVLCWPDLVYTELICMVILTVILIGWSILILAPIEEPANPAATPNPSKAPWYFLGLQEMLVYFDPWLGRRRLPESDHRWLDRNPICPTRTQMETGTTPSRNGVGRLRPSCSDSSFYGPC